MAPQTSVEPQTVPSEFSKKLLMAVIDDREDDVERHLEQGADLECPFEEHGTVLQAAACRGKASMVRLLLNLEAEIQTQCGPYGNALQAAAANGHKTIVKLLLSKGADAEAEGGMPNTALQAAIKNGHSGIAKQLIQRMPSVKRRTYLQLAAEKGDISVIEMLIPHQWTDSEISQAIIAALTQKHTLIAGRLIEEVKILKDHGKHILHAAVQAEDLEVIRSLSESHIHADLKILALASNMINKDLLKLLIEGCSSCRMKTKAASAALERGDTKSAEILFTRGALVDRKLLMGGKCGRAAEMTMLKHADPKLKAEFDETFAKDDSENRLRKKDQRAPQVVTSWANVPKGGRAKKYVK